MSIARMERVPVDGEASELAWQYEDSLSGAGNGAAIIIPDGVNKISVTAIPAGGCSVKVQATTDKINDVEQEKATVDWVDWDIGLSATTAQDVSDPCTAIRLVQSGAGSSELKVRAQ